MEPLTFRASEQKIVQRKQTIQAIGLTFVAIYSVYYLASPLVWIVPWTSLLIPCGLFFLFGWFVLPKVAERFSLKLLQESSAVLTEHGLEYQLGQQKEKISYGQISSLLIQENRKGEVIIIKARGAGQMTLLLHSLEQMNQLAQEITQRMPDPSIIHRHRSIWNNLSPWWVGIIFGVIYGLAIVLLDILGVQLIISLAPLWTVAVAFVIGFYRPFSKYSRGRFLDIALVFLVLLITPLNFFTKFDSQDPCNLWNQYIKQSGCLYVLDDGGAVLTAPGEYPWIRRVGKNIIFAAPRAPVGIWTHRLPHPDHISGFQVSGNGKTLLSWTFDVSNGTRTLRIWDIASGLLLQELSYSVIAEPTVALSPDGRILALSQNGQIELRDVNSWEVQQTFQGGGRLAFSPNGRFLAGGKQNNAVTVWDIAQGIEVVTFVAPPNSNSWIESVAFTPDSQQVVGATIYGDISVWHIADGNLSHQWSEDAVSDPTMAISPDGRFLAVSFMDSNGISDPVPPRFYINIWQLEDGQLAKTIQWENRIDSLNFSADGQLFVVSTLRETAVFRVSQFLH